MQGIILLKIMLGTLELIQHCSAEAYFTDYCMCQLDNHLTEVVTKLNKNKTNEIPPTPTTPPEEMPATTTADPSYSANVTTIDTANTTGDSSTSELSDSANATTIVMTSTTGDSTTTEPSDTTTEEGESDPPPSNTRRKRAVGNYTPKDRSHSLGILGPTGKVSYDSTLILSDVYGVKYDKEYNAERCECKNVSTASLSFCLLNVPFISAFNNIKSVESRKHLDRLLPWVDGNLREMRNGMHVRTLPKAFSNNSGDLQVTFDVALRGEVVSSVYEVQTAFEEPSVRKSGEFEVNGYKYETDLQEKKCYSVQDTTPAEPEPESTLGDWGYLFLVGALVVMVGIFLCLCCGSNDAFYARFW